MLADRIVVGFAVRIPIFLKQSNKWVFLNGVHFIHLNVYNVMHSKTEIIFFTQEKTLLSCLHSASRKLNVFLLLLLTASHSS